MKLPTTTFGWFTKQKIAFNTLESCAFTIGPWCVLAMPTIITVSWIRELCHCMKWIYRENCFFWLLGTAEFYSLISGQCLSCCHLEGVVLEINVCEVFHGQEVISKAEAKYPSYLSPSRSFGMPSIFQSNTSWPVIIVDVNGSSSL